ncbi:MAG: hypothetical protein ACREQO_10950 [Candidatus Binatia bacterium]
MLRVLETHRGEQDSETRKNTTMKQIDVHGQQVKLYSPDGGCTWSSSPQSIVAYARRKKRLRLELQSGFAQIDEMRDLDPDDFSERHIDTPKSLTKAKEKIHGPTSVNKAQLDRLDTSRAVSGGYAQRLDHSADQVALLDHGGFHRKVQPRRQPPRPDHFAR